MATINDLPPKVLHKIFRNMRQPDNRFSFTSQLIIVAATSKVWHINSFEAFREYHILSGWKDSCQSDTIDWDITISAMARARWEEDGEAIPAYNSSQGPRPDLGKGCPSAEAHENDSEHVAVELPNSMTRLESGYSKESEQPAFQQMLGWQPSL